MYVPPPPPKPVEESEDMMNNNEETEQNEQNEQNQKNEKSEKKPEEEEEKVVHVPRWTELTTTDATFEDIKEYKFVQARISKAPVVLAVVTRARKESHQVTKKGSKVVPSVDGRICITFKPGMYKNTTPIALEVRVQGCSM